MQGVVSDFNFYNRHVSLCFVGIVNLLRRYLLLVISSVQICSKIVCRRFFIDVRFDLLVAAVKSYLVATNLT